MDTKNNLRSKLTLGYNYAKSCFGESSFEESM